jgi:hypothetical protein
MSVVLKVAGWLSVGPAGCLSVQLAAHQFHSSTSVHTAAHLHTHSSTSVHTAAIRYHQTSSNIVRFAVLTAVAATADVSKECDAL